MSKATKPWALVTGAGGFIGHHLVSYLKAAGYRVRGVDIKRPEYGGTDADEFMLLDLRELKNCQRAPPGWISSITWRPTWAASDISPRRTPGSPTTIP